MTEQEIIKGCKMGDRRSQSALYTLYYPLMNSVVSRYAGGQDDRSILINTGFMKVLKNIKQYKDSKALSTWIRTVIINSTIDEFRKVKNKMLDVQLDDIPNDTVYVEQNSALKNMEEQEVLLLLNVLPPTSKLVFNLYAIDGFKHNEIADMLKISAGTSRWHLNFARNKLKDILTDTMSSREEIIRVAK